MLIKGDQLFQMHSSVLLKLDIHILLHSVDVIWCIGISKSFLCHALFCFLAMVPSIYPFSFIYMLIYLTSRLQENDVEFS